jgi:hypothetical protein
MPSKPRLIEQTSKPEQGLKAPAPAPAPLIKRAQGTLKDIVREALLRVLSDDSASAAAKASAGRTLLEYFDNEDSGTRATRRGADMTAAELDSAIADLE